MIQIKHSNGDREILELHRKAKDSIKHLDNINQILIINRIERKINYYDVEFELTNEIINKFDEFFLEYKGDIGRLFDDNPLFVLGGTMRLNASEMSSLEISLGSSYSCRLFDFKHNSEYKNLKDGIAITTNIFYSLSPLAIKKYEMIIFKKYGGIINTSKSISNYSANPSYKDLKSIKLQSMAQPKDLETLNVGQGNFSIISCKNGSKILYDVGFTFQEDHTKPTYQVVTQYISKINSSLVILSHFDFDHILGSLYLDNKVFKAIWIVPEQTKLTLFAARLLACIKHFGGKTFVIKNTFTSKKTGYYNLIKGKSKITSKNSLHKKYNAEGLILEVCCSKNALLTGDSMYTYFTKYLTHKNYDYLAVPHHGQNHSSIVKLNSNIGAIALVSVGYNTYGHPASNHLSRLQDVGFNIQLTMGKMSYKFYF